MATFALVHGWCHGGWCWKKVARLLRSAEHDVLTPTLTGSGERIHLATQDVGLDTYIQDITSVLMYEDLYDVVLVGHSGGGVVVSGVADRVPERIRLLVFLDAVIPQQDKALVDLFIPSLRGHEDPILAPPWLRNPPALLFFGVTDQDDLIWMAERVTPQPTKPERDVIHFEHGTIFEPRAYIFCTIREPNTPSIRFAQQARDDGWIYREINAVHDVMITEPIELSSVLQELAAQADGFIHQST